MPVHLTAHGANSSITEDSPFNAPALVSWKVPIQRRVLGETGMRGAVIVSGVACGDGGDGIPGLLLGSPRDGAGNLIMLGTGQQHWPAVHAGDLAVVFRRVLEDDTARGYYYFAEVLLLDQSVDAARARTELGWQPSHPALADEFRHGSYRAGR